MKTSANLLDKPYCKKLTLCVSFLFCMPFGIASDVKQNPQMRYLFAQSLHLRMRVPYDKINIYSIYVFIYCEKENRKGEKHEKGH